VDEGGCELAGFGQFGSLFSFLLCLARGFLDLLQPLGGSPPVG
jgi:hypothetical protein